MKTAARKGEEGSPFEYGPHGVENILKEAREFWESAHRHLRVLATEVGDARSEEFEKHYFELLEGHALLEDWTERLATLAKLAAEGKSA